MNRKYQLRYAAGLYWLIDTGQPGIPYKKPLSMNEAGAEIFHLLQAGLDREEITQALRREYQAPEEVIRADVEQFLAGLAEFGIEEEMGKEV